MSAIYSKTVVGQILEEILDNRVVGEQITGEEKQRIMDSLEYVRLKPLKIFLSTCILLLFFEKKITNFQKLL
jgi:hypothetical protein